MGKRKKPSPYERMTAEEISINSLKMLYLIGCALRNDAPDAGLQADLDEEKLYLIAKKHSLCAVTEYALRKFGFRCDSRITDAAAQSIRKTVLMKHEREMLFAEWENAGIRYLPLKGIMMEELYPSIGLREMSDNDILVDDANAQEVYHLMVSHGYDCKSYGKGHHDIYVKKPCYVFEIHRMMFDEDDNPDYAAYYSNVFEKTVTDGVHEYGYRMSREDFYIYMILHAKVHFDLAGTGLRLLVDLLVFGDHFGDELDWSYIAGELKDLGAGDFEQELREIEETVFSWQPYENFNNTLFDEIALSGTYGNYSNLLRSHFRATSAEQGVAGKIRYFKYRFSVPEGILKKQFPFFYRHKALVPVLWVYRPLRKLIKRPSSIPKELKALHSYTGKK